MSAGRLVPCTHRRCSFMGGDDGLAGAAWQGGWRGGGGWPETRGGLALAVCHLVGLTCIAAYQAGLSLFRPPTKAGLNAVIYSCHELVSHDPVWVIAVIPDSSLSSQSILHSMGSTVAPDTW